MGDSNAQWVMNLPSALHNIKAAIIPSSEEPRF